MLQLLAFLKEKQEQAEAELKHQESREELEEVQAADGVEGIRKQAQTAREKFRHGFTSIHRGRGAGHARAPPGLTSPRA